MKTKNKPKEQWLPDKNFAPPSDLQSLISDFETITHELRELDLGDKDERDVLEEKRKELQALQEQVNNILAANERARRVRMVKLSNLQELLRPILFPVNQTCEATCEPGIYRTVVSNFR